MASSEEAPGMAEDTANVAFKVTWVYGEHGPWSTPCTPEGRLINILKEGKVWCRQPECKCHQILDTDERLPEGTIPCLDYGALRDPWEPAFATGTYHHGDRAGQDMPMRKTSVGKFAFLTSRRHGTPERDRIVIACFRIDRCGPHPDLGRYAVAADIDSPYSLRVPLDRLDRAPRFWHYRKTGKEPRGGTGLFRYVPDDEADAIRESVAAVCDGVDLAVWRDIEAVRLEEEYTEGQPTTRLVSYYERNPRLKSAAVAIHGTRCQVCEMAFSEVYGELGGVFIEAHHLKPVADYKGEVRVDPESDMAVVCPNCHRMLHLGCGGPFTVEELREVLRRVRTTCGRKR